MIVTKRKVAELFSEQVRRIFALNYHIAAGKSTTDFRKDIDPLWDQIEKLEHKVEMEDSHFPIALVVPFSLVGPHVQLLSFLSDDETIQKFSSIGIDDVHDVSGAEHGGKPYLIFNIRVDRISLSSLPMDISDWYFHLNAVDRKPLTVEEGLALFTHFKVSPSRDGIAFLGSRVPRSRIPHIVESDLVVELRADDQVWCEAGRLCCGVVSCKKRLYSC